jgi:hypothetical protein
VVEARADVLTGYDGLYELLRKEKPGDKGGGAGDTGRR